MRKLLGICCVLAVLLLTGCCTKHEWKEATCTEPKHCVKCGEIEGEPLGHDFEKATCTTGIHCRRCGMGMLDGQALGHTWTPRTLKYPKTCSVCGETEGEPISFTKYDLPVLSKEVDSMRFTPESIICGKNGEDRIYVYDYDEKLINTIDIATDESCAWSQCVIRWGLTETETAIVTTCIDSSNDCKICMYNARGEKTGEAHTTVVLPEGEDNIKPYNLCASRYVSFYPSSYDGNASVNPLILVDVQENCLADPNMEFDFETFVNRNISSCQDAPIIANQYAFIRARDGRYGYLNKRYSYTEALYQDATNFNSAGYALVSNDGKSYDLIDLDLNVVGTACVEGDKAHWEGDIVFAVRKDGVYTYYSFK